MLIVASFAAGPRGLGVTARPCQARPRNQGSIVRLILARALDPSPPVAGWFMSPVNERQHR